jgi:hypothetical protein
MYLAYGNKLINVCTLYIPLTFFIFALQNHYNYNIAADSWAIKLTTAVEIAWELSLTISVSKPSSKRCKEAPTSTCVVENSISHQSHWKSRKLTSFLFSLTLH